MAIGCCSNFQECSDQGRCLFEIGHPVPGDLDFANCMYKSNLDKGLNFYTEYNENNRRRKEEYEARMLKDKSPKVVPIVTETRRNSSKTYIEIPNRIFSIGKRIYNGWTRDLKDEDREEVVKVLESKNINCFNEILKDMTKNDEGTETDRCNYRAIVKIKDKKYNIQNYNSRMIRRETAVKIASYLIARGLDAEIEILQGSDGSKIIKSTSSKRTVKKPVEKKEEVLDQLSMLGEETDMHYVN